MIPPPLILVVEDEPLLLLAATDMVEDAGLRVVTARDAEEAKAALERHGDIRLIFSDIDLPGSTDGLSLVSYVHDRWPPVAIMLTSGHVHPAEDAMPAGAEFFSKPYSERRVIEAMHRLAA